MQKPITKPIETLSSPQEELKSSGVDWRGSAAGAMALFARRLRKRRDDFGWTQAEASRRIKVNLRTYQYWENGEKPPRPSLLARIAGEMEVPPGYFFDENWKPLVIRDLAQIVDREQFCAEFWIMKTGKPFVSAEHPETRLKMIDSILSYKVHFFFVFAAPLQTGLPGDASASFQSFLADIEGRDPKQQDLLRPFVTGLPIQDVKDAYELGLCDDWMAFVLAVYNQSGERKYSKSIDVWIEFSRETGKGLGKTDKEGLWVELSRDEARTWYARRKNILNGLQLKTSNTTGAS